MNYKTIVLEFLLDRPQIHQQLRKQRMLLPTLELYATALKTRHEAWKARLAQTNPSSEASQAASEALEMALHDLESSLPLASHSNESETLSLDAAMTFIRHPTPPA